MAIVNMPSEGCPYIDEELPATSLKLEFHFQNWVPDASSGQGVACYIDGELDGIDYGSEYVYSHVPSGFHRLCCLMIDNGNLAPCATRACTCVRVSKPCDADLGGGQCDDGNPCTGDFCLQFSEGARCRHTDDNAWPPYCCKSGFDCLCAGENLDSCTFDQCTDYCWGDGSCEDGDKCTIDLCTEAGCKFTYVPCEF